MEQGAVMFPEETHEKIVKQVDEVEADLFRLYRKLMRLRLGLQRQWRVLPNGERWTERSHQASDYKNTAAEQGKLRA
jgi:hypothetical protein